MGVEIPPQLGMPPLPGSTHALPFVNSRGEKKQPNGTPEGSNGNKHRDVSLSEIVFPGQFEIILIHNWL